MREFKSEDVDSGIRLQINDIDQRVLYDLIQGYLWLLDNWTLFKRLFMTEENRIIVDSNPRFFSSFKSVLARMIVLELASLRELPVTGHKSKSFGDPKQSPILSTCSHLNYTIPYFIVHLFQTRSQLSDSMADLLTEIYKTCPMPENLEHLRNKAIAHRDKSHFDNTYDTIINAEDLQNQVELTGQILSKLNGLFHDSEIWFDHNSMNPVNNFHDGPPPNSGTIIHQWLTLAKLNSENKYWGKFLTHILLHKERGPRFKKADLIKAIESFPDEFDLATEIPHIIAPRPS